MKKIKKRISKIVNILIKNASKMAKQTVNNKVYISQDMKFDGEGTLHFILKLDFPVGKVKIGK